MRNAKIPVLGFAAYSGTGKTTLLTRLIPLLKQRGLRIGLIKHSHHSFNIDQPGKDSFRLREAGASPVMLISKIRRAVITDFDAEQEPLLDEQLQFLDQSQLDLILVEGFKHEHFPKIELYRPALNVPLLFPHDPSVIALATDTPLPLPTSVMLLDINDPPMIADFICNRFMRNWHA
ncbi:MAG: molybdopterin-guanine dinucleotide biosynthesis protein B [Gammaproteobacteria bacterium]